MKNNIYMILLTVLICIFNPPTAKSQVIQNDEIIINDTINKPAIALSQNEIFVAEPDSGKFIVKEISFYNKGGGILYVNYIDGSCGCSTAKLLNNNIGPSGFGTIELSINMDGVEPDANIVEYLIYSNAKNTPVKVKVVILKKEVNEAAPPENLQEK